MDTVSNRYREFLDSVTYQEPGSNLQKSQAKAGTLTGKLAQQMAACKSAQLELGRDLKGIGHVAKHRHDQAVDQIRELDKQIEADPDNHELHQRRDEYDAVRGALVHCCSYADGMQELLTGKAKQPIQRHAAKDASGLFTRAGSLGHRIREALNR